MHDIIQQLEEKRSAARLGGGEGRIESQHRKGKLTARERLELIGTYLRAAGAVDLGRFSRLSDYVNYLGGFFTIEEVTLLARTGAETRRDGRGSCSGLQGFGEVYCAGQ